jgi:hypothetical protein
VTAVPVNPSNLHDIVGASTARGTAAWHLKVADGGECCDVGTIKGPPGTPYEGGVFQLEITIPSKCAAMFVKRRGDRRRR